LGQTGINKDGQDHKRNAADKHHQALFIFSSILFILVSFSVVSI